ncbi:E3 ubiquitin-protein ligase E3D [Diorhabda sublineata]|uniref:E3 ubiquitin-protein ligase E3D n=1 Tax=Diorhabda sublineata TaxID=1163346 RepID=UPI0024E0E5A8|nr:E3 ubiquitin-protein ligase E3D [Diorhabda sublineata]
MAEVYKTVLLEIRPRLQCVNAFIKLCSNRNPIEVVLEHDAILLLINKEITKIGCKNMKIVTNSLSSLRVTVNFLSFRFLTEITHENKGSFKAEFLQNTVASIESLSNKPLLSTNSRYIIQCANCKKSLSNHLQFHRVLPLPSETLDASDWFCHNHGNSGSISLDPKPNDLFYSQCFVHINIECAINLKVSNNVLVCKFCLKWLGKKHNNNTIKLWFNTVMFSNDNTSIASSSLEDCFQVIKNTLKLSLHNASKLILSCQTSRTNTDTLLLWVLEKNLHILFGEECLKDHHVAKVLFKFVKIDDILLKEWHDDSLVSNIDISKPMMVDLLTNLYKCNELFPLEYSKSNDFRVSYLFLSEIFQ